MSLTDLPPIKPASEIFRGEYPEPRYLCDPILPQGGLCLIAGPKASGKTQIALNIASAVARGELALGKLPCDQAKVLFIELELSEVKIHHRMHRMKIRCPENFDFAHSWPAGQESLLALEQVINDHGYQLIIIDVMQRIWGNRSDPNQYNDTYRELSPYRQLANKMGVTILMATHTRKLKDVNVVTGDIDTVLGSVGIVGNADAVLIIRRVQRANEGVLHVIGNDIPDQELSMRFDRETTQWIVTDEPAITTHLTPERREIYDLLVELGVAKSGQLAEKLNKGKSAISNLLSAMVADGVIKQVSYGEYEAVSFSQASESSESGETHAESLLQLSPVSALSFQEPLESSEVVETSPAERSHNSSQQSLDVRELIADFEEDELQDDYDWMEDT